MGPKLIRFIICAVIITASPISGIFVQNELRNISKRHQQSPAEWTEPQQGDGIWSSLLEEWTITNK